MNPHLFLFIYTLLDFGNVRAEKDISETVKFIDAQFFSLCFNGEARPTLLIGSISGLELGNFLADGAHLLKLRMLLDINLVPDTSCPIHFQEILQANLLFLPLDHICS